MLLPTQAKQTLESALAEHGLRSTRQRECVFAVVAASMDHPTADAIYSRVRESLPGISLATVYNTLETLVSCGLVRQVNFEREPSRYCPLSEPGKHHAHFHCTRSGKVFDVHLPESFMKDLEALLPPMFRIDKVDLCISGQNRGENPSGHVEPD